MTAKQIKHKGVILSDKEVNQRLNEQDKRIKELEEIITRLEQKEQNKEKDNVIWALNQFRYKKKTEDERKAFCIIESVLNTNESVLNTKW